MPGDYRDSAVNCEIQTHKNSEAKFKCHVTPRSQTMLTLNEFMAQEDMPDESAKRSQQESSQSALKEQVKESSRLYCTRLRLPSQLTQPCWEWTDSVFSAAQRGDLALIQSLVESKGIGIVHERDAESCTLLHWAAINNHLELCRWLVQNGAQVDAIGGTLLATPVQWASRYTSRPKEWSLALYGVTSKKRKLTHLSPYTQNWTPESCQILGRARGRFAFSRLSRVHLPAFGSACWTSAHGFVAFVARLRREWVRLVQANTFNVGGLFGKLLRSRRRPRKLGGFYWLGWLDRLYCASLGRFIGALRARSNLTQSRKGGWKNQRLGR